ncbi:MAG: hypothetical protein KKH93_05940 [Candidatus Omnitrophica bacterium]|nr:hypothetical protein [Candidatus Omnitrophota bacterium]MBU2044036.1 hypothetical protein [Candidatus Omnitrophota bacterium]MBU2473916.1 hypothetical protein [Candidatus Omnitrophota bacterium]
MEPEVYQLKNDQIDNLSSLDADAVREQVVKATRDFKNSWRNLAKVLYLVWDKKLYRNWGYDRFDQFSEKEVHVRKHTAMKLIRSYQFLEKEEPLYLQDSRSEDKPYKATPSFETIATLQRARKTLGDDDYRKVKSDLLDRDKDPAEVKKDLTQLIRQRRKDLDPEEARTRSGRVAIERFISELKKFKRDIETLSVLPEIIAYDIGKLINKIEGYIV